MEPQAKYIRMNTRDLERINATRKRRNNASNIDNDHSDSKKQKLQDETKHNPTQQQLLITNFVVPPRQTSQYPISTTPDHNDLGVT